MEASAFSRDFRRPNVLPLSCAARARVPKPTRRDARHALARRLLYSAARERRAINVAGGVPPAFLVC
jgi:hypothetical protein